MCEKHMTNSVTIPTLPHEEHISHTYLCLETFL